MCRVRNGEIGFTEAGVYQVYIKIIFMVVPSRDTGGGGGWGA